MEDRENTDRTSKRKSLDLSFVQVAASALATVAGALLASELGVYGTIIGAAVVSVGATIGGAVFQHVFRRTGEQIRNLAPTPAQPTPVREEPAPAEETRTFDPFDPGGEDTRMLAAVSPPPDNRAVTTYRGRTTWKPRRWTAYALMALLAFGLAMGTLTVVELVAGKPLAAIVQNEPGSGTSLGGGSAGSGGSGGSGRTPPPETPSGSASDGGSGSGGGEHSGGPSPTPSTTPSSSAGPTPSTSPSGSGSASPTPSGSQSSTPTDRSTGAGADADAVTPGP